MPKANFARWVEAILRIRPDEHKIAGLMFTYLLCIVSTFILGRTVRDTLFLYRVDVESLPLMYLGAAIAVSTISWAYSKVADRYRRDYLIISTLSLFALVTCIFYAVITLNILPNITYIALYIGVEALGAISVIQFWTLAGDIFSSRQSKRVFGTIGAGAVVANIVCGFAIGSIAPKLGSEQLLLINPALYLICIILVASVAKTNAIELKSTGNKTTSPNLSTADYVVTIAKSQHLRLISLLILLTYLTVTIVDYQFKIIAADHYNNESALAGFFGQFYGVTGIIASLTQLFLTSRILEKGGLVVALLTLPIGIGLGAASIFLVPIAYIFYSISLTKGAENVLRYTINDSSSQILYSPVSSAERGRAKAFIDGVLKPCAIGSAGITIYILSEYIKPTDLAFYLAIPSLVIILFWIYTVIVIRKAYISSLVDSLKFKAATTTGAWKSLDEKRIGVLKNKLDNESDILHAFGNTLEANNDLNFDLEELATHPSLDVRIAAIDAIGSENRLEYLRIVKSCFDDEIPEVRAAGVRAYSNIAKKQSTSAVIPFLEDSSIFVRSTACVSLLNHGSLEGVVKGTQFLQTMISHASTEERLKSIMIIEQSQIPAFYQPLLELMEDSDPRVRQSAILASGSLKHPSLIPALINRLADKNLRDASIRALTIYGNSIESTVLDYLKRKQEPLDIRRQIPQVVGTFQTIESFSALIEASNHSDSELRTNAVHEAVQIRKKNPQMDIDQNTVSFALMREIRYTYQTIACIEDLALNPIDPLAVALQKRYQEHLKLTFKLLEICYPTSDTSIVYASLSSDKKSDRANAVEVAESILSRDEAKLIIPLLEDTPANHKAKVARELFDLRKHTLNSWLPRLLEDPDTTIVAAALTIAANRGFKSLAPKAARLAKHQEANVRKAAYYALRYLLEKEQLNIIDLEHVKKAAVSESNLDARQAAEDLVLHLVPQA